MIDLILDFIVDYPGEIVLAWIAVAVLLGWALGRGAAIADQQLADPTPNDVEDLEDVARDTGVLRDLTCAHDLDEAWAQLPRSCPDSVPAEWGEAS